MKAITFKYTKADNKVSNRVLFVTSEPAPFVSGVDISELEPVDQVSYLNEVAKVQQIYQDMLAEINREFDVVKNFRQFKPESMTNIVRLQEGL